MSGRLCLRLGSCTDRVVYIPQHTAVQDTQTPEKKTTLQPIAIFWAPLYRVHCPNLLLSKRSIIPSMAI